ncbi:MAG: hypothetical protein H7249_08245 [Chitinophagaceae bacterium]|nr:hypothetical protein [Oligoflexus sp.]
MSILMTAGLLVLAVLLLILLSLGLIVAFGILLIGGLVLGVGYLLFGHGSIATVFTGHNQASKVPQEFNQCLLGDDLDKCRTEFTTWTPAQMELVRQLAKQVLNDLGERVDETTQSASYEQSSVNGETTISIDQETDFAKKKTVHEHYLLINDSKTSKMKIKDLKWDYGTGVKP